MQIKIGSLTLKNPITVASGTAGYGEELSQYLDLYKLGAIFTKGLSLLPRKGNEGNRVLETPAGLLNSIGLENVGLDAFLKNKLPYLIKKKATVIPNIAGHSEEENIELSKTLSKTSGIKALELNVSCPNVKEGGIAFGTNKKTFTHLLEKVREVTNLPLIVKLNPNVHDITDYALIAQKIGVDAISAVNTFLGMKIDIQKKKPYFKNKIAGLSGPAIKPLAIRIIYQLFEKINIPIIGLGGISNLEDALEFIMAGASIISIGTMNLINPKISLLILKDLENYCQTNKIYSYQDLIGLGHEKN